MLDKTVQFQQMCDELGIKPIPETSSDSEDERASGKSDAFISGLRLGVQIIRNHTRSTLATCETESKQTEMKLRLESETIKLIRSERMLMETSKIVAGIVDDITGETDDEEDFEVNLMPKLPSSEKLLLAKDKMAGMLDERMGLFEDTLTRACLETNPQFVLLQEQIVLAEGDFERKQGKLVAYGGTDIETNGATLVNSIQYEDETDDEEVLPRKDPITKKFMMNPVRNKICHHIFEHATINEFMDTNPGASCPMLSCLNKLPLEAKHLINDQKLVAKMRNKNLGSGICISKGKF